MFEKKIDKGDLKELRKRTELINQHILIAQALDSQKQALIASKFSKYGLDGTKNYEIDLRSGKIKEVKPRVDKK